MTMSPREPGGLAGRGAGNESTLVGWSLPRQVRLSLRIAESLVSTIASSVGLVDSAIVDSVAAASAMARRNRGRTPRLVLQRADSTRISTAGAGGAPALAPLGRFIPLPRAAGSSSAQPGRRPARCA